MQLSDQQQAAVVKEVLENPHLFNARYTGHVETIANELNSKWKLPTNDPAASLSQEDVVAALRAHFKLPDNAPLSDVEGALRTHARLEAQQTVEQNRNA